jgi:hypothetical protein
VGGGSRHPSRHACRVLSRPCGRLLRANSRLERLVELARGTAELGVQPTDAAEPARVVEQLLQRLEHEALHLPQLHPLGDTQLREDLSDLTDVLRDVVLPLGAQALRVLSWRQVGMGERIGRCTDEPLHELAARLRHRLGGLQVRLRGGRSGS